MDREPWIESYSTHQSWRSDSNASTLATDMGGMLMWLKGVKYSVLYGSLGFIFYRKKL